MLSQPLANMKELENNLSDEPKAVEHFVPESVIVNASATPQALVELVGRQNFFKGLSPNHLEQLADSALQMQFEKGQRIFREGDLANRFYIILEGKVVLESEREEGEKIPIQTLGPGDDLGWSWLFLPYYLHFSARAAEPSKVLFFYGTRLRQQCEEDHDLGYELMKRVGQVVVQRLEATQKKLSQSAGVKKCQD
jgi:CRP/FNR family transcriptional regulator, cyclic AMP receptor protein